MRWTGGNCRKLERQNKNSTASKRDILLNQQSPSNLVQATEKEQFNRHYRQAAFLLQAQRYSETITYAMKAIAVLPEDPRPYGQIAHAMAFMKNPEAPEWAKKAIVRDPSNGMWRGLLSQTYTIQGKWKEGLQPMRDGLSLSPNNAWLNSNLGVCLLHAKKFREAVPYLQKAVELDPQNPLYHVRLSNALLKTKDRKGSDDHLRTALALKPDDDLIQTNLGWRLRRRGRRIEANETFREALRLNPRNPAAKIGLGVPLARRAGLIDPLFRFSFRVYWMPRWRLLVVLQWLTLFGFLLLASPYVDPLQGEIVAAFFLAWVTYFSLAGRVVRVIGKRRGVHFK